MPDAITLPKFENLSNALDGILVDDVAGLQTEDTPIIMNVQDWFGVSTPDDGIIAFFMTEREALRYRLDLINRCLNG